MLMVGAILLAYTLAIFLIVIPGVEYSTRFLEEKNGKEGLNKVVLLTNNMQQNLDDFQKNAMQYHKKELKDLTAVFWSMARTKYEQSRPENIGSVLRERGNGLQNNLNRFYQQNKESMSRATLERAIINYVNIFRYDGDSGHFFIQKGTTVVEHPIYPEFTGKDFDSLKDENGIYFVREFKRICEEKGSGILKYQWKNARTKEIEEKVAYVFKFEPFDWVIGTTASVRELQDTLKNEVIFLAEKVRYGQGNYFFINGYDYRVIAHPYVTKGADYSRKIDSRGNLIVPPMIRIAREKGEGFTQYWWKKDPEKEKTFLKLTFSKDFPEWQMVISTGIYIDSIQKEVHKRKVELTRQLRQIMKKTVIGKSGYLFIVDDQARMIVHRNHYMEGKDTGTMKNPSTGHYIFNDLVAAAREDKPLYFKWDRPDDKGNYIYEKVAWVKYIPGLHWYVASSAYVSELQSISRELKDRILLVGFVILFLAFVVSLMFFKRLFQPILELSDLASRVTRGDFSARSHLQRNDELGVLSREFNVMVDTIEDSIQHLDENVAAKTGEIEEQNRIFETLFYESSDGVLLLQDGQFVDCNRAAYTMLKYENKDELIRLHPSEISPMLQPDGRNSQEKADEKMTEALEQGGNRFEWVHKCKDGSDTFFEVVLTSVVIRDAHLIHVVWRDINEKKAAEKKLQKTLSEFSAVMDGIDYGVLFMDDQLQARIVNKAFREIWNVTDEFVATMPSMRELMEFNRNNNLYPVPDSEFEHYLDERESAVRDGAFGPVSFERKDGMVLQYQCVVLADGWRMLTYFDITELKNTQDKLARAQKMEAIGVMAGGVAHDLNNILSGIVSYPDLLLMQLPETSSLRKPIEAIQESGERAATVVDDLLTVARGVASTRKPHDLNVIVHEYLCSPEGEKLKSLHPDVSCLEDLQAEQSVISCSPVHIKKTVMNLVANAVESIENRGEVYIATSDILIEDGQNTSDGVPEGRYVVLTIRDNGPGIGADDIQHIFEPFYSKKVMGRSGTGLGLTVVWNTVEDHGGQIRVASSTEGTCFTLYFPVSFEKEVQPKEEERNKLHSIAGEHILIVDDEAQLLDIAAQILTSLGYRTSTAASGEEAIGFLQEHSADLLLLDMLMEPGINGRQTYEAVLQQNPGQRAIVASGFAESEDVKKTLQLGAWGFIKKPYSFVQLGRSVKEALAGRPDS